MEKTTTKRRRVIIVAKCDKCDHEYTVEEYRNLYVWCAYCGTSKSNISAFRKHVIKQK